MMKMVTLEEGMTTVEEGIVKAKMILDGYSSQALFTGVEFMKLYDCIYSMCIQHPPHDYSLQLYERFKRALEESISTKVLPSLMDKDNAPLLIEVLHMWTKYRAMTKCLQGFFLYLDRHYHNCFRDGIVGLSLNELSVQCFHDMVCNDFYQRIRDAATSLICEDRDEKVIDRDLLKNVTVFLLEIGRGKRHYYDDFEKAILADASRYYSQLASEWLFRYSFYEYIRKTKWCLKWEKERAIQYLHSDTLEKLLQVVHSLLVVQPQNKLMAKQKAERNSVSAAAYQELLSQCANLNLGDGSSASQSQEGTMME